MLELPEAEFGLEDREEEEAAGERRATALEEAPGDAELVEGRGDTWTPKLAARVSAATIRGVAPIGPATPELELSLPPTQPLGEWCGTAIRDRIPCNALAGRTEDYKVQHPAVKLSGIWR